ncbi:putative HIT-like domain-containing protein [Helianthus anomalus]
MHQHVPPQFSGDPNQMNAPKQPVAPVPTRPTAYGTRFIDYNQYQTGFMNLLNQPLS